MQDRSEQALLDAMAQARVGFALWDADLRYRWVNPRLAEINGRRPQDHVGRTIPEVLPDVPDGVVALYRGVLEGGPPVEGAIVETEVPAAPGEQRSFAVSILATHGPDGRPDGLASFVEDVTELHAARAQTAALQDALALERRILAEVVERVPLGVTLLWGRELTYRLMNRRGRRMLPERGELVGRTPWEMFPETADVFAETVLPLFDTGEELVIDEYPLPFSDDPGALDGLRYYEVTFTPVSLTPGEVVGVLVAYVDVTGNIRRRRGLERELEEERRLSDTLQRALLPRRLPAVPHLAIAARYLPAGERYDVGGDFYDVFRAGDGTWLAVVGDVCGKGPRAAARTAMVRHCLRAETRNTSDPSQLLALLDEDVRRDLEDEPEQDFVTIVLASLRPGPRGTEVLVATAGHPPALITADDGRPVRTLGLPGLPAGVGKEGEGYPAQADVLAPGERLVLYTDGVQDAYAPGVVVTTEELAVLASGPGSAQDVADALLAHVTGGPVAARDDCAVLVLAQLG